MSIKILMSPTEHTLVGTVVTARIHEHDALSMMELKGF